MVPYPTRLTITDTPDVVAQSPYRLEDGTHSASAEVTDAQTQSGATVQVAWP